jgi:phosphonoacetaldehyde hydrolase
MYPPTHPPTHPTNQPPNQPPNHQAQERTINDYTDLIPGVAAAVAELRARGIKVGSTTGYSRFMVPGVIAAAKAQGYAPDVIVCADEVPAGRPAPFMAWAALAALGVQQPWLAVKVGDTVADIGEGRNAGMWAVGLSLCGNEVGLSEEQLGALPKAERARLVAKAEAKLSKAGAHYVIESVAELPRIIDHIEKRLARGERP